MAVEQRLVTWYGGQEARSPVVSDYLARAAADLTMLPPLAMLPSDFDTAGGP